MQEASLGERIAGSSVLQGAATLAATVAPTVTSCLFAPVTLALLPVLMNGYMVNEHRIRIESEFDKLNAEIDSLRIDVAAITPEKFSFINECVLTMTQTLDSEKFKYLKNAILNTAQRDSRISFTDVAVFSRMIRDISVSELLFIKNNFYKENISISSHERHSELFENDVKIASNESKNNCIVIPESEIHEDIFVGLQSLGLLTGDSWRSMYKWSPVAGKLLAILGITDARLPPEDRSH
ncbi:hypothetical protein [Laribacter hongkongensis]|uniref:Uncharacterized protein n=1 Tax=Laribacter hongkongensis TaxID=168471 RepID=A0ABD4SVZ1_9NEIS|nr:hypothetical protein [Laribacter hongkongensis]MCG9027413.1 hypothetical protein [Laribacter hongkongensis]